MSTSVTAAERAAHATDGGAIPGRRRTRMPRTGPRRRRRPSRAPPAIACRPRSVPGRLIRAEVRSPSSSRASPQNAGKLPPTSTEHAARRTATAAASQGRPSERRNGPIRPVAREHAAHATVCLPPRPTSRPPRAISAIVTESRRLQECASRPSGPPCTSTAQSTEEGTKAHGPRKMWHPLQLVAPGSWLFCFSWHVVQVARSARDA